MDAERARARFGRAALCPAAWQRPSPALRDLGGLRPGCELILCTVPCYKGWPLGPEPASARSGPGTRAGPTWAGPRRDKPGHGVTVATPGGDVTRDVIIVRRRSRLPPYPIVFRSSESAGVLSPYGGVSGPTGPDPALSRIGSLRGDAGSTPRGASGLPSRLARDAPKMRRSCALKSVRNHSRAPAGTRPPPGLPRHRRTVSASDCGYAVPGSLAGSAGLARQLELGKSRTLPAGIMIRAAGRPRRVLSRVTAGSTRRRRRPGGQQAWARSQWGRTPTPSTRRRRVFSLRAAPGPGPGRHESTGTVTAWLVTPMLPAPGRQGRTLRLAGDSGLITP